MVLLLVVSLNDFVDRVDYGNWRNEFQRDDVSIMPTRIAGAKNLLAKTLVETRFSLQDLDQLFVTFALDRGLLEEDAQNLWDNVKMIVEENIVKGTEHNNIDSAIASAIADLKIETTLNLVTIVLDFRQLCFRLIRLATQYNPSNVKHTIGVLGEVLAFLYARDVANYDCIHHKLVPDSLMTFRHGMDLLAVKFNHRDIEDEVHFIEAKATTARINSQRDEVIKWFNTELAIKANTMIDQAKRNWRKMYPDDKFKRASRALCRFQIYANEISKSPSHYIGSIVVDVNQEPTDNEVLGFKSLQYAKKQLVIIKAPCMVDLSREIFDLACKT